MQYNNLNITTLKHSIFSKNGMFGCAIRYGEETQPYKFGGKELDNMNALNWYDYSARHYDAAGGGRFTTPDPHAENYYSWSPYAAFGCNPQRFTDPTGMDWYEDDKGNIMWQEGNEKTVTKTYEGDNGSFTTTYNNIGTTYTAAYNGVSITYEQNEAVSMKETILEADDFHFQMNSNGTKKSGEEGNCFYQAGLMVSESGAESLGGTANNISNFEDMRDYLDTQADVGQSARVHVDRTADGVGDHWVAISSRTINLRTNTTSSFGFFDPGTSRQVAGTSPSNQLSVKPTSLTGTTNYNSKTYTVVNVRRNR
jgi:RHS repeat-associated protein